MERGFHHISDREYFALDIPSASGTKPLIRGTNAHLAWKREQPPEQSDAFAIGAYTHALCLTPEIIGTEFIRAGRIDRRTTEGKAKYADLMARAERTGARLITDEQAEQATAMADAVKAHPTWVRLGNLISRREVVAIGDIDGVPCKCKIDATDDRFTIIVDLKTTQSAAPADFSRSIDAFGYAHQAAFYRAVLKSLHHTAADFVFVCVEKDAPHLVAAYRLADRAIDAASARLPDLVRRWRAVRDGDRTGYPNLITDIDLPSWAYGKDQPNE